MSSSKLAVPLRLKRAFRLGLCHITGLSEEDLEPHYTEVATYENFFPVYNDFVKKWPYSARVISDYRPSEGIGPGEMIAYFLFDNVEIGGKNAPWDIYAWGIPFAEMKAGRFCQKANSLDDFKLSKDQSLSSEEIVKRLGNKTVKARSTVDNTVIADWRESVYQELRGETLALIQTSDLSMRHFGPLKKEMVDLYRVHRNQPWARVYLPKE